MKKLRMILLAFSLTIIGCLVISQSESRAEENYEKTVEIDGVVYDSNEYSDEEGNYRAPTEYMVTDFNQAYDEHGKPLYTDIVMKDEINGLPVTRVNGFYFSKHSEIESIVFPKHCEYIAAFSKCYGLKELIFPNSVKTISGFDGCINVEEIKLPSSLTHMGGFSYCTSLKSITIPKSVKSIGGSSFEGCTLLEEIIFENPNPENIRFTGKCFQSTAIVNLAKATGKAVVVGDGFLLDFGGLRGYVNLSGDKIRAIAPYAFSENGRYHIRRLRIDGVAYIGEKAFYQCYVSRLWLDNVKVVGDAAFNGSELIAAHVNNIEQLGKGVFAQCKRLVRSDISGVQIISARTFKGCAKLKKVTLKEGTAQIDERCFYGCKSLKKLIIQSKKKIKWDEKEIFKKCNNLRTIIIKSKKVSSTIKSVKLPKGVKLDVPEGSKAKYRKYVNCKIF